MTSALEHSPAAVDGLRSVLRGAGYTSEAIRAAISAVEAVTTPGLGAALAYVQIDRDDPFALLVRLFWLATAEPLDLVRRLLPDLDVDRLGDAGLLDVGDDRVRSVVRVDDVFGLLIASDVDHDRDDCVVGVSPSTRLAATYTPRVHARTALDVGCGQGLQALLAARHCERVVATDFSRRALWLTNVNAGLNEIDNVETRHGSFLEPVVGERFDLAVINPPYVVSPGGRFLYRDGGVEGDGLSRALLADLPGHLEEGGFGVLQGNWIHGAEEGWFAPIERGLVGSSCDAILARISTAETLEYAAAWNEPHYGGDPDGFVREVRSWVAHLEDQGIERISGAMVVMRRRAVARNWRRAVSLARHPLRLHGDELAALFDGQDRLAELDDDALLATRLCAPAELRVERFDPVDGDGLCVLDLDSAIGARRPVSAALADIVLRLGDAAPPREVGGAVEHIDGIRALVKLGFLRFA